MGCNYVFTFQNHLNKRNNEKVWFERWIKESYSIRQLSNISKHSHSKLKRIIRSWLDNSPKPRTDFSKLKHVIFDGTFIHGRKSIVVMMRSKNHEIYAGKYGVAENSIPQLKSFFIPIVRTGFLPKSATVDGNSSVIKLLKQLFPDIIIQRCLVHIQRQGMMWCRRFPKRTDAKHLRKIFQQVTYIRTKTDKETFLSTVGCWENKYGYLIEKRPEQGKVFSDIKRARSLLLKALPNMFHYLENRQIPFSTNGLEGYFSRLKADYRHHRGLSPNRRKHYFDWYFHLKNR